MSTSYLAAVDFGQGVSSAWSSVASFVPKLVAFLVIMVIGWIVAKVVAKVVSKVLEKVGFNRVVERGGLKQMLAKSNYSVSDILSKIIYYAILLIALQIGLGAFGPNPVSDLVNSIVLWLPKALVGIVIVVVAGAIAKAVRDLVSNALSGLSYGKLLGTIASVFIWGLGVIAALNQIGVATTVTMPVLITVLATIAGIAIVGMGGGLVRPMQQRWESWLGRAENELPAAKARSGAYQRGREDVTRRSEPPTEELQQQPAASAVPPTSPGVTGRHGPYPPAGGQR